MCPEPQLISIYVDGELPSPWKEKMEAHLKSCPVCRDKYTNFKSLRELFKKDNVIRRRYVERVIDEPAEERTYTEDDLKKSQEKVWDKIASNGRKKSRMWRRRLSVPVPIAAAAAVVIALATTLWIRGEAFLHNAVANRQQNLDRIDLILAAEEEMPDIIPASNINDIIQYLASDGTDVIILRLPESSSFSRTGEPAIIRAADYTQTHGRSRSMRQYRRHP